MSLRPNKQMLIRILFVMVIMILCITIVSGSSLVKIMVINGEKYQSEASKQQLYDNIISAPRGDIYDTKMNVLATSSTAWTVYIMPNGINNLDDKDEAEEIRNIIADGLAPILEMDKEDIYQKTTQKIYYVTVKKKVEKDIADKVRKFISDNKENSISKYVGLDETNKRYYPNDTLASTVLGFVGDDNQGLAGVESYYDNQLTGVAGRVVAAKNAHGTDMRFTYEKVEESRKGESLVLSIDSYIQYTCEKYLDLAVAADKIQEDGAVVVMDVNTGAIRAMAVSGDFNPNSPFTLSEEDEAAVQAVEDEKEKKELRNKLLNKQWRNKAVSDTYEPGSVFKIFTASVALEEALVTKNSSFTCNYVFNVASNTYHCHKRAGHGTQHLAQAIANSCNPAFIQIGQLIGTSLFNKYFKAFGFTEKTGIDLPGEASPYYHKEEDMGIIELSSSSFGQTFNVTPLQMLSMAAAAVNGGNLVQPHIVEKTIDADGKIKKTSLNSYKRQVISESTSAQMRELLEYVVQNGAKNAIVPGYRIGGKTGTSEKVAKMIELKVDGLYISSYLGIAPINDPEIAVFVMLDEPTSGRYYGGLIAAPVGAQIMADILPYLGYEPQYSESELKSLSVAVPDVGEITVEEAKTKVRTAGLTYKVVGAGEKVVKQLPLAGNRISSGGTVIIYTDGSTEQTTTVPDFTGLSVTAANAAAAAAGINIEFTGNTTASGLRAYNQSIAPETSVALGEVVSVYFREDSSAD